MARGKYKHRKEIRDVASLEEEITDLIDEIAAARKRCEAATRDAAERAELEAMVRRCVTERDRAAQPEIERLTSDAELLASVLQECRAVSKPLHAAWRSYMDRYIAQNGNTGLEAIESFIGGVLRVVDGPGRKKLDADAQIALDKARGERRADYVAPGRLQNSGELEAADLAPPSVRGLWQDWLAARSDAAPDAPMPQEVKDLIGKWRRATAATLTPEVALAGHPHPCVDTSLALDHPMAEILGVDLSPPLPSPRQQPPDIDPLLSDRGFYAVQKPWKAVEALMARWRVSRDIISDPARIPTPLHNPPRHPSPADAVAMLHWYSLAAAGAWVRNAGVAGYGEVAVGLAAATTFWMPAGQVSGYLDSEPIPAEDRARIRLAYPNVFLALGQPIVLPPSGSHSEIDTEVLEGMSQEVISAKPGSEHAWLLNNMGERTKVNVLDLISAKGAQIEAVLLMGDHEGNPSGKLAWCLAVPGRLGVLGRWVLPAHRDRTAYSTQVDALLAVAAWADWHTPADPATTTTTHRRSAALQHAAATGRVHILNASRTAAVARSSTPTGRTVSAHIRRGHWRRQPFGPGRTQMRMVRIAPTIIGAGTLRRSALVYRLPEPSNS